MVNFKLYVKLQHPSFISFIVRAVGMTGRVELMNFNVTFSQSLVLSSHPPDEPLCNTVNKASNRITCMFHYWGPDKSEYRVVSGTYTLTLTPHTF